MPRLPQIIVADDDKTVRTVIVHALSKQGYQVGAATTAAGMWDIATSGRGTLLITDVGFPDGDALELLPRLQERRPDLSIIVMSARANLLTAIKTQQSGVFDYLPKPFELKQLIAVVEQALSEQPNMPSADVAVNMPASISPALMGKSPTMQNTFKLLARLSSQSVPVLIKAESGSGKPLIARTLHEMGQASDNVFEMVSLSQLPSTAHDEILFGAEGLYHKSEAGSLFINGIEGLSPEAQMSLARRMESGRAPDDDKKAPRIITGTHLELKLLVDQGLFRDDLFFDLSVGVVKVPPLRDRLEDIGQLASYFCEQFNQEFDAQRQVSADAVGYLQSYHWPGNVRELENLIRRMFISNNDISLSPDSLSREMNASRAHAQSDVRNTDSLGDDAGRHIKRYFEALKGEAPAVGLHKRIIAEVERPLIEAALYFTRGNQIKAAHILGLNRNTLRKKIRDLNISPRRADYRAGG